MARTTVIQWHRDTVSEPPPDPPCALAAIRYIAGLWPATGRGTHGRKDRGDVS